MNAKEYEIYQAEKKHSFWSGFGIGLIFEALIIGIIYLLIWIGL